MSASTKIISFICGIIVLQAAIPGAMTANKPVKFNPCKENYILLWKYCYYFREANVDQFSAAEICRNESTELVHTETEEENRLVTNYLNMNYNSGGGVFWTSGFELDENRWVWPPLNISNMYNDWGPDEPHKNSANQHCIAYYYYIDRYYWFADTCESLHGYICQHKMNL